MAPQKRAGLGIAVASAVLVALVTLTPTVATTPSESRPQLFCILCGELGTVDFILNLALFIPLGAGLRLAGLRPRRALIAIFASTFLVELLQLQIVPGRDASLGDLLANTLGGIIGVTAADRWRRLLQPRPRQARMLAIVAAGLCLAMLALTAWGLDRSLPEGRYWGQWRRLPGGSLRFGGVVLGAELNGRPLPATLLQWDDPAILAIHGDSLTISATILPGPPTRRVASIASVGADPSHRLIVLAQRREDFVFRIRLRASELLLRSPSFGIPGVLSDSDNGVAQPVRLQGSYFPERVSLRADQAAVNVPLTVGMGWSFLVPVELAIGRWASAVSALWLAMLFLPLAYWATKGWRVTGWTVPMLVAVVGLALFPLSKTVAATSPLEWLGVVVGIAAGVLLARSSREEPVTIG